MTVGEILSNELLSVGLEPSLIYDFFHDTDIHSIFDEQLVVIDGEVKWANALMFCRDTRGIDDYRLLDAKEKYDNQFITVGLWDDEHDRTGEVKQILWKDYLLMEVNIDNKLHVVFDILYS